MVPRPAASATLAVRPASWVLRSRQGTLITLSQRATRLGQSCSNLFKPLEKPSRDPRLDETGRNGAAGRDAWGGGSPHPIPGLPETLLEISGSIIMPNSLCALLLLGKPGRQHPKQEKGCHERKKKPKMK